MAFSCASMFCIDAETVDGDLIEVKSTTDVKDHHLEDVAIQHRVVTRSGIDLAASCLAHVNREYVYEGGAIDAIASSGFGT